MHAAKLIISIISIMQHWTIHVLFITKCNVNSLNMEYVTARVILNYWNGALYFPLFLFKINLKRDKNYNMSNEAFQKYFTKWRKVEASTEKT